MILRRSGISLTSSLCSLTGKFSIRLVPDMTTAKVTECVLKFVKEEFAKIDTKCKMSVEMVHGGEPWMADPNVSILFAIFFARLGVLTWSLVHPASCSTTTTGPLTRLPRTFTGSAPITPVKEVSTWLTRGRTEQALEGRDC